MWSCRWPSRGEASPQVWQKAVQASLATWGSWGHAARTARKQIRGVPLGSAGAASLQRFLQLPERYSKQDQKPHTKRDTCAKPLGQSRARRLLMLENAAALGDTSWLELIVEAGVDLDARNLFGQTALFIASWFGHAAVVRQLQGLGADSLYLDTCGTSCAEVALQEGHQEVLKLLRAEGQQPPPRESHVVAKADPLRLPANSWLFAASFSEHFLLRLDALARKLPVPEMEIGRRAAERLFFCRHEVRAALMELLERHFPGVWVSPWLRFLRYRNPGMPLVPHVDYQWLPGYISAEFPGYSPPGRVTSHTLLLYLTDCHAGGETQLLESQGTSARVMASVSSRRGRVLLFPHDVLHEGTALERLPKVMLRADALLSGSTLVQVIELYKNRLSDVSAQALSVLLEHSPPPGVHGFHLSHNYFTPLGVGLILASAARSGYYPARRSWRGTELRCPMWLRVEQQLIKWEALSGLPEEEQKHRAELLLEEKSASLIKRCQAEGRYFPEFLSDFKLLCMPEGFESEASDSKEISQRPRHRSCSSWCCVHIQEEKQKWPMVHLPYFWSQKAIHTLEPPEGHLLKLDPGWRNWRPRLPLSQGKPRGVPGPGGSNLHFFGSAGSQFGGPAGAPPERECSHLRGWSKTSSNGEESLAARTGAAAGGP
eukprot:s1509_g22.t2